VTCCSLARPDYVFAAWFKVKLRVKGYYPKYLTDGGIDFLTDLDQYILRKISEYILSLLQHRYQTSFCAPVFFQKLVQPLAGLF
jgi:hypothetical protein